MSNTENEAVSPQVNVEANLPRRKMTIDDQAVFLHQLKGRCVMLGPEHRGAFASETILTITKDDLAAIDAIHQTLRFLDAHGVQSWIRGKLERRGSGGGNGGRR